MESRETKSEVRKQNMTKMPVRIPFSLNDKRGAVKVESERERKSGIFKLERSWRDLEQKDSEPYYNLLSNMLQRDLPDRGYASLILGTERNTLFLST